VELASLRSKELRRGTAACRSRFIGKAVQDWHSYDLQLTSTLGTYDADKKGCEQTAH